MYERILFRALGLPAVYRTFGRIVAGDGRGILARDHIRARDGQRVLDIGCGPADILTELPNVDYTGFDANPAYIASAKRNHGNRGRFYCQRVNEEALGKHSGFDIVLAIGVVHHLDDDEAEKLFRLAHSALAPGGRLVTLDGCYVAGQPRIARFLLSRDRGSHVRNQAGYVGLASRVFTSVDAVVRGDLLAVPYTNLILECQR